MFSWVIHKLASVLPPAIDADSERMCFSTTQKRLFLRETRFLFFSDNGPVEFLIITTLFPGRWRCRLVMYLLHICFTNRHLQYHFYL